MSHVEVFPTSESLTQAAAEQVVLLACEAIAARGRFAVALSGGSTPKALFALLASAPLAQRVDWPRVHVFWGDERCVPPDDPRSNFRMAHDALLGSVPLPERNIHRIHGEDDPAQAAAAYEQALRDFFARPAEGFDLVLLGMGDEGHTASLFPGRPTIDEPARWVAADYIEKVAMWRVTLTPVVINRAANITFLIAGAGKADVLHAVLEGPYQPHVLPAQVVHPSAGRLNWFVDASAAAKLRRVAQHISETAP